MMLIILTGIVFLAVAAIVVGIVDATQAGRWRQVAAERRERWEERVLELPGGFDSVEVEYDSSWDED